MAIPQLKFQRITPYSQSLLRAEQTNLVETQNRALQQKMVADQLEYQDAQAIKGGQILQAIKTTPLPQRAEQYKRGLQYAKRFGIDVSAWPARYTPEADQFIEYGIKSVRDIEKQIGKRPGDVTAPSAVREYEYYKGLPPTQQQEFLNVKRNVLQTGLGLTPTGDVEPLPGITGAKEEIKTAEARGVAVGKLDVEREKSLAKANSALKGLETQTKLVTKTIDDAISTVNKYSTGYGSYLSFLPNTDARKLKNYLDTIRANVGFDKLQQMRENSPTGGALGQVSEMENRLLQAVNGALDPAQADQLVQNLTVIKGLYPQVLKERREAFNYDYGKYLPEDKRPQEPPIGKKEIRRYNPKTGRLE